MPPVSAKAPPGRRRSRLVRRSLGEGGRRSRAINGTTDVSPWCSMLIFSRQMTLSSKPSWLPLFLCLDTFGRFLLCLTYMKGWLMKEKEAAIIPLLLSQVLEPKFGPIAGRDRNVSRSDYRKIVMDKYTSLLKQFPTAKTPVFYGEPFSVKGLALRLFNHLRGSEISDVIVARDRHRFEAATGVDCRDFFQEGNLRVSAAAAIVENYLKSPEAEKYENGIRYFFVHRILD